MKRKRDRIQSWNEAKSVFIAKIDRLKNKKLSESVHAVSEEKTLTVSLPSVPKPPVCWCGLIREHHDGREMDQNGNMHQFNKPVYAPGQSSNIASLWPDDYVPTDSALRVETLSELQTVLADCEKLLQNQIANPPVINAPQLRSNAIALLQSIKKIRKAN